MASAMCARSAMERARTEVEGVEELLRLLVVDLFQRLAHGERRARVLGHGVGLNLRLDAIDRKKTLWKGWDFSGSFSFLWRGRGGVSDMEKESYQIRVPRFPES